jgi:hypothetical protein
MRDQKERSHLPFAHILLRKTYLFGVMIAIFGHIEHRYGDLDEKKRFDKRNAPRLCDPERTPGTKRKPNRQRKKPPTETKERG